MCFYKRILFYEHASRNKYKFCNMSQVCLGHKMLRLYLKYVTDLVESIKALTLHKKNPQLVSLASNQFVI
jgi:hypothetical protein